MPRLLELFCGTKSVGRAFEAAGWEVVSLDIVSKFEPTILCDIRSWTTLRLQPRADDAPAAVLSALEIIAHFDPLMWVIENPATGLLKTRPFMERLPCGPTCAGGRGEACAGPAAAARRGSLRAAQRGPRLREGQCERASQSRELLYSVPAALCEEIARAATEELAERLSIPD